MKAFSLTGFTNALYHPRLHFARSPGGAEKRPLQVIKLDIINRVADKTGVPKMKAEQAVEALFHSMKEALTRGERIELRGFGVFVVKPRKRGVGRNPRTGEEVAIPSGKTIRFKPGKELQAHEDGETVVDDSRRRRRLEKIDILGALRATHFGSFNLSNKSTPGSAREWAAWRVFTSHYCSRPLWPDHVSRSTADSPFEPPLNIRWITCSIFLSRISTRLSS